nr:reverse transcriptase domain-containing protein [Tanacetum cinerariifolium]
MTDNRTMAEMLCAPIEGCAEAIVVPPILAEQFELKHRAGRRWLKKEPPRSITTWDDLVSKFINEFFPPSQTTNIRNEISNFQQKFDESFHEAWERYKDLLRACPHHGFTELHQLDTFYNALNPANQDSLNAAAGGNLLEKINQQTRAVTTAMMTMLKQLQANPPPAQVKAVEEICVTCEGNYSQGNPGYRPQGVANRMRPPGSGSLPGNTVANPKGELKAITTRSGLVTDGPTVSTPPKSVTPEEDECVEETYTDPDLAEYTIKVPPPPVQKPKPPLGLPDLIPTRMTLELANRAICTPDEIARDVFISVGKFTFPANFVVVDYESDPRAPLILGRPFLRTARALIDVHGKEMILRDGDKRLTLNMKHDTASYSNHPHRESANLINIFNVSSEDCLEVLVSNKKSGNPTFSLHKEITSPEVTHEIHDSEGCNFLSEKLPDIDSFNDIHPYFDDNPLSGSTTYSSNSLLEEFTDELALITYPPDYDDNLKCDIESDLREIEFLLYQGEDSDLKDSIDQMDLANFDDYFVDLTPEMFTDEHAPDYSFPSRFDVYLDDFLEIKSDADNFYDDPFDSKGEKIKEDDDLPSPDNEDKVFNSGNLIHEKLVTIITRVAQEKKLEISKASLVFEDSDPLFYEPIVFKDVPNSIRLLLFLSENEEKVFKPGIYTSEKVLAIRDWNLRCPRLIFV